jgi:hypothetical protein
MYKYDKVQNIKCLGPKTKSIPILLSMTKENIPEINIAWGTWGYECNFWRADSFTIKLKTKARHRAVVNDPLLCKLGFSKVPLLVLLSGHLGAGDPSAGCDPVESGVAGKTQRENFAQSAGRGAG